MLSRTRILPALAAAALGLVLTGCAGADETQTATEPSASTPESTPSETASPDASQESTEPTPEETVTSVPAEPVAQLDVTIAGGDISPNAESIELAAGEPLVLAFDSDRAGELHVHSKPDQYVDFEAGTSRQRIVIDTPGLVEIEDHDTNAVLAVVEVK